MKRIILTITLFAGILSMNAQQWNGNNNTIDPINRTGNVSTNGTITSKKSVINFEDLNAGTRPFSIEADNSPLRTTFYAWGNQASGIELVDRNDKLSFHLNINSESGANWLRLKNKGENNDAIALRINDVGYNAISMTHAESRIVVGSWGSYLMTNDFGFNPKLAIKDGGAIIEGRVVIGTQNDDVEDDLIVDGKILCQEVEVVQDATPDYVFQKYYLGESTLKEDYTMPTLEEVEAFTKANHHLPEVPSAEEIKEEGMGLKQMSTLLLQKVEELTLYTIEQEKRINALEAKLAEKE